MRTEKEIWKKLHYFEEAAFKDPSHRHTVWVQALKWVLEEAEG